jgi:hypothetical protein
VKEQTQKKEKKKQWRQRGDEAVSVHEDGAEREEEGEEEEEVDHAAAREADLLRQGRETRWKMREYGAELRHQETRC